MPRYDTAAVKFFDTLPKAEFLATDMPAPTSETIHTSENIIMNIDIMNTIRSISCNNFRHINIVIKPKRIMLYIAIAVLIFCMPFTQNINWNKSTNVSKITVTDAIEITCVYFLSTNWRRIGLQQIATILSTKSNSKSLLKFDISEIAEKINVRAKTNTYKYFFSNLIFKAVKLLLRFLFH